MSHVFREDNCVIDKLASQAALTRNQNWWMHIPNNLALLAYRDHTELPFFRFSYRIVFTAIHVFCLPCEVVSFCLFFCFLGEADSDLLYFLFFFLIIFGLEVVGKGPEDQLSWEAGPFPGMCQLCWDKFLSLILFFLNISKYILVKKKKKPFY